MRILDEGDDSVNGLTGDDNDFRIGSPLWDVGLVW